MNIDKNAELFYNLYGKDFYRIISIPTVACAKLNGEYIPYEYAEDREIRYKRDEETVDKELSHNKIALWCARNRVDKFDLLGVGGGNLYMFINFKRKLAGK